MYQKPLNGRYVRRYEDCFRERGNDRYHVSHPHLPGLRVAKLSRFDFCQVYVRLLMLSNYKIPKSTCHNIVYHRILPTSKEQWEEQGEDGASNSPFMLSDHSLTGQPCSEGCRESHSKCEYLRTLMYLSWSFCLSPPGDESTPTCHRCSRQGLECIRNNSIRFVAPKDVRWEQQKSRSREEFDVFPTPSATVHSLDIRKSPGSKIRQPLRFSTFSWQLFLRIFWGSEFGPSKPAGWRLLGHCVYRLQLWYRRQQTNYDDSTARHSNIDVSVYLWFTKRFTFPKRFAFIFLQPMLVSVEISSPTNLATRRKGGLYT